MGKLQMTPAERDRFGAEWFEYTMTTPAPPADSPYRAAGIRNFVFAEMWSRPGLDMRSRRWITLACVAAADTVVPIKSHVYAALKSGDITFEEIQEFVIHFAVYSGWPKASFVEQVAREAWERVQSEGGTVSLKRPAAAEQ
jgi:4-carboxymuconolactone decarboxylase